MNNMKGILLAGGTGSRLSPATDSISKHLLPIYDKPMIYYPLSVLMLAKIRDILIICDPNQIRNYSNLLGNGSKFGINLKYKVQKKPEGIAQGIKIAGSFIKNKKCCLILGDNIFYGSNFISVLERARLQLDRGALIFGYPVNNPEDFGVAYLHGDKVTSIKEKPKNSKSNLAIPGLYFYDENALDYVQKLRKSKRGEYEITDLNKIYLKKGLLNIHNLGRGFAWLDTGNHSSLLTASNFIQTIEDRQDLKVACLEEIAISNKWLSVDKLRSILKNKPKSSYYEYLRRIAKDDSI